MATKERGKRKFKVKKTILSADLPKPLKRMVVRRFGTSDEKLKQLIDVRKEIVSDKKTGKRLKRTFLRNNESRIIKNIEAGLSDSEKSKRKIKRKKKK